MQKLLTISFCWLIGIPVLNSYISLLPMTSLRIYPFRWDRENNETKCLSDVYRKLHGKMDNTERIQFVTRQEQNTQPPSPTFWPPPPPRPPGGGVVERESTRSLRPPGRSILTALRGQFATVLGGSHSGQSNMVPGIPRGATPARGRSRAGPPHGKSTHARADQYPPPRGGGQNTNSFRVLGGW